MDNEVERFVPTLRGRISYEHLHRYVHCQDLVANGHVLDVACGEGYGSHLLLQTAASVVGVDTDAETLAAARTRYGTDSRICFTEADCRKLPFDSASFDAVVSFETIEHIPDPERCLSELRRVLRPTGLLIISTPNRPIYNQNKAPNRFHLREFDIGEFEAALRAEFTNVLVAGQRFAIVSSIGPLDGEGLGKGEVSYRGFTVFDREVPLKAGCGVASLQDPEYIVALCSNSELPKSISSHSMFLSADDDLWLEYERTLGWASRINGEYEAASANLRSLQTTSQTLQMEVEKLRAEARPPLVYDAKVVDTLSSCLQQLSELRARLDERACITASIEKFAQRISKHGGESKDLHAVERIASAILGRPMGDAPSDIVSTLAEIFSLSMSQRMQVESLRAQLARVCNGLTRLTDCKLSLTSDFNEIEVSRCLAEIERDHKDTAREVMVLTEANAKLQGELDASRNEVEAVSKALFNEKQGNQDLELSLEQSRIEVRRLQGYANEAASLAAQVRDLGSHLERQKASEAELRTSLSKTAAENEFLRNELTKSTGDLKKLASQLQDTRSSSVRASMRNVKLLSALRSAKLGYAELERNYERHLTKVAAYERGLALAHGDMNLIALENEGYRSQISALMHRLQALDQGYVELQLECDEATSREQATKRELNDVKRGAQDLRYALTVVERTGRRAIRESLSFSAAQISALERSEKARKNLGDAIGGALLFLSAAPPGPKPTRGHKTKPFELHELVHLGNQANRDRDWDLAERFYAAALRIDPLLEPIWIQYGHALKEQNKLHLAELAYRAAVKQAANSVDGNFQLARLLAVLGNPHEARELFSHVLELDPCHDDARRELSELPPPPSSPKFDDFERVLGEAIAVESATEPPFGVKEYDSPRLPPTPNCAVSYEWPPHSVADYWLPQKLRDYIYDRYGDHPLAFVQYLMSIVEHYDQSHDSFSQSRDCQVLVERAQVLSVERSKIAPEVSIIIPVYNNIVLTLTSIVSILENKTKLSFEILVGDDLSTDETSSIITSVGGCVRLISHHQNGGFLRNCNETALRARGKFLVMLNNDTLALPGWLDELVVPLAANREIGMTGSKLINADGTLQEAGGIVWRDGSAWNFGRGSDPREPEFNYNKSVDYVSGASIALRTETWFLLDGFDSLYAPAYCEDSDLAFRARSRGFRVLYTPRSEIIHHEGRSHGKDELKGIKAYQVTNKEKFLERWKSVLEQWHNPNGENVLTARDRSGLKPHLLIVDHYVPEADRDAGSRTMFAFIKGFLDAGFQITFWPSNLYCHPVYGRNLQDLGVEVIYGARFQDGFRDWLNQRAECLDYVLLSRPALSKEFLPDLERYPHIGRLYYGHDLHFKRLEQQLSVAPTSQLRDEIDYMRELELEVCTRSSVAFYPTAAEVAILRELLPSTCKVSAIPAYQFADETISHASAQIEMIPKNFTGPALFVGGFGHPPNADAIYWFVREVMPIVAEMTKDFTLDIVGSNMPSNIAELRCDRVNVRGMLSDSDLVLAYTNARLAIVPLRFGGGIKGKVIEAMANGVPVAMTAVGAQGIPSPEQLAFLGDGPEEFARAVAAAWIDREDAKRRALAALAFIQKDYSAAALQAALNPFVPEFGMGRKRPALSI